MDRTRAHAAWFVLAALSVVSGAACTSLLGDIEGTGAGGSPGGSGAGTSGGGSGQGAGGAAESCHSPGDCPIPETSCEVATCSGSTCGVDFVDEGEPCLGASQCDGKGNCVQCLMNEDCGGAPLHCAMGVCVGCHVGEDCPETGTVCLERHCLDGACAPKALVGTSCVGEGNNVCSDIGACVECNEPVDCVEPKTCSDHICSCTPTVSCASAGLTCGVVDDGCSNLLTCDDGLNGNETDSDCGGDAATCATRCDAGRSCLADDDCVSGHCAGGLSLCGNDNGADCGGDGECASQHCAADPAGKCGLENGAACADHPECASGFCGGDVCS